MKISGAAFVHLACIQGGGYDIMTADKGILSETALAITLKRTEPEVWRKEHRNGTLSIKIFFICCKI